MSAKKKRGFFSSSPAASARQRLPARGIDDSQSLAPCHRASQQSPENRPAACAGRVARVTAQTARLPRRAISFHPPRDASVARIRGGASGGGGKSGACDNVAARLNLTEPVLVKSTTAPPSGRHPDLPNVGCFIAMTLLRQLIAPCEPVANSNSRGRMQQENRST